MAAPGRTAKGRSEKAYYSTDGTTFTELTLIDDAEWSAEGEMENVTNRSHGRANRQESYGYNLSASFSFKVPEDKNDAASYAVFRDADLEGTPLSIRLANGSASGADRFTFWAEVSSFSESQPINGHIVVSVAVVATSSDDEPTWDTVA